MGKDSTYTNGVIAVKEKYLLNDKIYKLCEGNAEEALRTLQEAGFGKGIEIPSVYEYEKLISADEAAIDEFIREYSPSGTEAEYLLSPRDFHNAKALIKAHYLNLEEGDMLGPEGLIPISRISNSIIEGKYENLPKALSEAVKESVKLFTENENGVSGAEIGYIFEKAQFAHLKAACSKNLLLKKLLSVKADMTNILTALRCENAHQAENCYVEGGKLSKERLNKLFLEDREKASHTLDDTPYAEFVKKCFSDKAEGRPLTEAEKICESLEIDYFSAKRYELKRGQPFLFYVFRRRAENANVRILFVCLLAGMSEGDIKRRLR